MTVMCKKHNSPDTLSWPCSQCDIEKLKHHIAELESATVTADKDKVEMMRMLNKAFCRINKVNAPYRHGNPIGGKAHLQLGNYMLELEEFIYHQEQTQGEPNAD